MIGFVTFSKTNKNIGQFGLKIVALKSRPIRSRWSPFFKSFDIPKNCFQTIDRRLFEPARTNCFQTVWPALTKYWHLGMIVFGKILNLLWQFFAFGQTFIVVEGQFLLAVNGIKWQ